MERNVLLVIKADDRVNYLQKEKKAKREPDGSFATLLNGFMSNQEKSEKVEQKVSSFVRGIQEVGNGQVGNREIGKREIGEKKAEKVEGKVKGNETGKEKPLKMAKREEREDAAQIGKKGTGNGQAGKVTVLKFPLSHSERSEESLFSRVKELCRDSSAVKQPQNGIYKRGSKRVENRRMGEWENGKMGEWENGRMGKTTVLKFPLSHSERSEESLFAKKVTNQNQNNSLKILVATKSMRTEKIPENLIKRNLKLKAEKVEYRQLIQDKESTMVREKEVFVEEKEVFSKVFKEHKGSNTLTVKLDSFNSSHNISQEKSINLNGSRASQVESQTLKEFVKSHYEPMEGVVRFYTEMTEENSVKVLLNSRLGIAKLLFLSTQNNFQINSSVIQNLVNTLNNLGFSNVSVGYNNYYGEGKNGGNQSFRENRNSKFIPVTEVESEEEEWIVQSGIDIMV